MSDISDRDKAIRAALNARRLAHAPYSGFRVGAAIVDLNGLIHSGCNIENSSYSLTVCAERVAIMKAVSEGSKSFSKLVIASSGAAPPCGACRQVLAEFAAGDLPILLVDAEREEILIETCLDDLLPMRFSLD